VREIAACLEKKRPFSWWDRDWTADLHTVGIIIPVLHSVKLSGRLTDILLLSSGSLSTLERVYSTSLESLSSRSLERYLPYCTIEQLPRLLYVSMHDWVSCCVPPYQEQRYRVELSLSLPPGPAIVASLDLQYYHLENIILLP
jgi:hypothetical protein